MNHILEIIFLKSPPSSSLTPRTTCWPYSFADGKNADLLHPTLPILHYILMVFGKRRSANLLHSKSNSLLLKTSGFSNLLIFCSQNVTLVNTKRTESSASKSLAAENQPIFCSQKVTAINRISTGSSAPQKKFFPRAKCWPSWLCRW